MPKRHGNLYPQICTIDALHRGYLDGRRGKRNRSPVARFEANLGAELTQLAEELQAGTYAPMPYRQFYVHSPKKRQISAPAFRDVVVQHAIYAVIYPLFDAGFIHDSYGCRVGKGTHRASNRAQQFLRQVAPASFLLQMDIRKFYYSIDRAILRQALERKIKDTSLVDLIMLFADTPEPLGLPIGNLLSQLFALIYLNPLDHFIKRDLGCKRYVRYVDDFIVFGLSSRVEADALRQRIGEFLATTLRLEFSRYSIQPVSRGVNFVGFRTWRSTRFVRRHSLHTFSRSLKRGAMPSLVSIMGNARHSATYAHFCRRLRAERPDLIPQLPESHRHACHHLPLHPCH